MEKLEPILKFIESQIHILKSNNFYRTLRVIRNNGCYATVDGRRAINLSSNDYLGLSQHPSVISEAKCSVDEISSCSSRLVAGNSSEILNLETLLAKHRGTESSLVYPTGYSAMMGTITAIADKETIIFSDELNHASIVDGCRLSGAKICVFKHNDAKHLDEIMNKNHAKKKMLITEGVFSITGDIPNLKRIFKISKEYDALTIIDDAHGDFVFGYRGSGTPSYLNANSLVDVHVSSLSKGLGSFGGYVATTSAIREFLVNKSRQFIFTSALPNHLCRASIAAIKIATRGIIQENLFANIRIARTWLSKCGLHNLQHRSQIIPIQIGDEDLAWRFAELCLRNGVFVYPMRFPSVKKGSSVIRLSLTALLRKTQLLSAFKILQKVKAELISK